MKYEVQQTQDVMSSYEDAEAQEVKYNLKYSDFTRVFILVLQNMSKENDQLNSAAEINKHRSHGRVLSAHCNPPVSQQTGYF